MLIGLGTGQCWETDQWVRDGSADWPSYRVLIGLGTGQCWETDQWVRDGSADWPS